MTAMSNHFVGIDTRNYYFGNDQPQEVVHQHQRLDHSLRDGNNEFKSSIIDVPYDYEIAQQDTSLQQQYGHAEYNSRRSKVGNDDGNCDDNDGRIDITKSLYHLRLHGFDVVTKMHYEQEATSRCTFTTEMTTDSSSSPTRIGCVTPAVSPIRDTAAIHRKRSSLLPPDHRLSSSSSSLSSATTRARTVTNTMNFGSRPISPLFWEKKSPSDSKKCDFPVVQLTTATTSISDNGAYDAVDILETISDDSNGANNVTLDSFPSTNIIERSTSDSTPSPQSPPKRHSDEVNRKIRSTKTISDALDEFEVMLESSVSTDDNEYDYESVVNDEQHDLRNTSSILDSPYSHEGDNDVSVTADTSSKDTNDNVDNYHSASHSNSVSPQTPAVPTTTFCGSMTGWCDTTTSTAVSSNRNVFLDDCSTTPTRCFQLKCRPTYTTGDEWFCPPISNGNDSTETTSGHHTVVDDRQITILQNMLQSHICTSLGNSFETLCWQKSTTCILPKSFCCNDHHGEMTTLQSTPSALSSKNHIANGNPFGIDTEKSTETDHDMNNATSAKTKHRRSSTLPAYRRTDKFNALRYNLHPFDDIAPTSASAWACQHSTPNVLHKTQSFQYKSTTQQQLKCEAKVYPHSEVGFVKSEWECGVLDFASMYDSSEMMQHSAKGNTTIEDADETDCNEKDDGYESDPEIFYRRESKEIGKACSNTLNPSRPSSFQPSYTLQEFLNEKCTFIWHPCTVTDGCGIGIRKSIAVHVWIELGQQLYDSFVLPKLCWKPILTQPGDNADEKMSKKNHTNCIGGTISSIELLNISRIIPVENINRELYPFALVQRLFCIQSADGASDGYLSFGDEASQPQCNLILEARSIADRIRYTNLLKLTVSTLATKYITNDPTTLTMFFHSPSFSELIR